MKPRGWMFLKVLINRYHQGMPDTLIRYLPKEDVDALSKQSISSPNIEPLLNHAQEILETLHYTWLKPFIDKFPAALQPFITASLPESQSLALQRQSEATSKLPLVPASLKPFFLQTLYNTMGVEERLPIVYLPETPLSPLIHWKKNDLIELISFLGLHDLTSAIRHIVAKQALQGIYDCLSPKELNYLKICLHQKDPIVAPPLNINLKQLDGKQLIKDLHQRGLMRLGMALSEQHPDLVWYLSRLLDTGRGKLLTKFSSSKTNPKVVQALTTQVTNLMNYLTRAAREQK